MKALRYLSLASFINRISQLMLRFYLLLFVIVFFCVFIALTLTRNCKSVES